MNTAIPTRMLAVAIDSAEGGMGALVCERRETPRPGPEEVLIRVAAAGVNYADILQREGRYPPPEGVTDIPGLEVAGTIVALGERVREWRVGDVVCALLPGGGYAEYAVAGAESCLPVPRRMSVTEAAALPEALFTIAANVLQRAGLRKGETFLVHGGAGGIGHLAIQVARTLGARVFATAGSPEHCAFCRELGAELAVNYREADFEDVLRAHLGKRGIDVVLDHIGGDYVRKHLRLAAREGRIVNIAYLHGAKVTLDLMPVLLKWLTITGSTLRIRDAGQRAALRRLIEERIWPQVERGEVRPHVDATFALERVREAHARLQGPHKGKIVLRVAAE